jgi:predicted regulator of Ras-like GTPase activity (Roadblock/LC7/MglB family)
MTPDYISQAVEDIPALKAVFVTAMPDCLLFASWLRADSDWSEEQVATYFGDLFRSNREGLKALGSWSSDMQVTIEAPDNLVILRELNSDFVCGCVYERSAALGLVRLHTKQLLDRISSTLPSFEAGQRPRGVRVVEFLDRYAPDPHAVLLRVSLCTRVPMETLNEPEKLSDEQVAQVESAACDILGLKALSI